MFHVKHPPFRVASEARTHPASMLGADFPIHRLLLDGVDWKPR